MENNSSKLTFHVSLNPFIFIYKLITKRPIITLTLLYAFTLLILDLKGFFVSPPSKDGISIYAGQQKQLLRGRVILPPEERNGKVAFVLDIYSLNNAKRGGKTLINYKPKEKQINDIEPGDILLMNGDIKTPFQTTNPGGFNYAKYLGRKGIYTIFYAKSIEKTGYEQPPFYKSAAYSLRKNIIKTIKDKFPALEASLLIPMLVGSDENLSYEMKNKFVNAGVMHVLPT